MSVHYLLNPKPYPVPRPTIVFLHASNDRSHHQSYSSRDALPPLASSKVIQTRYAVGTGELDKEKPENVENIGEMKRLRIGL